MEDEQKSDSDETVSDVDASTLVAEAIKSLEAAHAQLPESDCILFYRLKVRRHQRNQHCYLYFPTSGLLSRLCSISLLQRRTSKMQSVLWMSLWNAFLIIRLVIGESNTRPTKAALC